MTGTYSQPYFENGDMAVEFYTLIGRMIVAWSAVERSVDLILWLTKTFNEADGKAIISWKKKIDALRKLLNKNEKLSKEWISDFLARLNYVAGIRNGIIHGYCSGMTNAEPPQIIFRASRFHADETETKQLSPTAQELADLIRRISQLESEILPLTFSSFPSPKSQTGE